MKLRAITNLTVVFIFLFAANGKADLFQPVRSKMEIKFINKHEVLFSDFGKIKEFQGVLVQVDQPNDQLGHSDLYFFKNESRIAMSKQLCLATISKIFGTDLNVNIKFQIQPKIFPYSMGKACEFEVRDSDTHAKIPIRFGIVGFVHGTLSASVWQMANNLKTNDRENLRNFWMTLR